MTDKNIAIEIAKANMTSIAKLGLRFDRVVLRIFRDLRQFAEQSIPAGKVIAVTVSAPIYQAAKTEKELETLVEESLHSKNRSRDRTAVLNKNKVRVRVADSKPGFKPKFIGFVHNPSTESKMLVDLATNWLRDQRGF